MSVSSSYRRKPVSRPIIQLDTVFQRYDGRCTSPGCAGMTILERLERIERSEVVELSNISGELSTPLLRGKICRQALQWMAQ